MVASMQKDKDMTNAAKLTTFPQKCITAVNSLFECPNSVVQSFEETDIARTRLQNSNRTRIEDLKETSKMDKIKENKEKSLSHNIAKQPKCSKDLRKTDPNNFHLTESLNGETVSCQENGDPSGINTSNDIAVSNVRKSLKANTVLYSKLSSTRTPKDTTFFY